MRRAPLGIAQCSGARPQLTLRRNNGHHSVDDLSLSQTTTSRGGHVESMTSFMQPIVIQSYFVTIIDYPTLLRVPSLTFVPWIPPAFRQTLPEVIVLEGKQQGATLLEVALVVRLQLQLLLIG